MAHTKNKPKYWRRETSKMVLMTKQNVDAVDEAGNPTVNSIDVPVVVKGDISSSSWHRAAK